MKPIVGGMWELIGALVCLRIPIMFRENICG